MNPITRRSAVLSFVLALSVILTGCAYFQPKKEDKSVPAKKPVPASTRSHTKPVDAEAQQKAYDKGMRFYAEENYAEAKNAWQQAIQLGPNTPVAGKARENIKKVEQTLKTLQEIEKK